MHKLLHHISEAFSTPITNPVLVFSIILTVILVSPIILRPIRVPGIIGLILFGVLLGPHGVNWIGKVDKEALQGGGVDAIDLFSTIGLLYIMFIAGLELDMNEFRKTRNKSLLFGFLTFALPISVGFPLCYFLLGYGLLPSVLIASMFATHTLVSYSIVNSYGISKNEVVAVTIGGTILTDTAVLLILAVITGASQGQLNQEFWTTLGVSFTVFLLIMFGIIPRIGKWFFRKIEAEKTAHYIFVLAVVFFAAFLAEIAGLEPIIGAFFAGLALNKLIPHSSVLMNRIEFIGNAIFIPFFLISVGMIVDTDMLAQGPMELLIATLLIAGAMSGKFFAASIARIVFRYSKSERNLIFGLSNARAATALAVIMVGHENHIIDDNILNATILLILVSCIVASIVTENASKKVVLEGHRDDRSVDQVSEREEKILIPIANLSNMERILDFATLIRSRKSPYPLSILSVVPDNEQAEKKLAIARKNLDSTARYAAGSETEVDLITTIDHNIASGIGRASKEIPADCIIIGWPSATAFLDKIVGEKAESILNKTDASLFMCRLDEPFLSHRSITLFVPPLAELEPGFGYWMEKIVQLARDLSLPIRFVSDARTQAATETLLQELKASVRIAYHNYDDWDNLFGLATFSNADALLVFVSSRYGEMSYRDSLNGLAKRVGRYFRNQNLILIFPSRRENPHIDGYQDVQAAPIFKKISREIGNMLKRH